MSMNRSGVVSQRVRPCAQAKDRLGNAAKGVVMDRTFWARMIAIGAVTLSVTGCLSHTRTPVASVPVDAAHYHALTRKIEYPNEPTPADAMLATTDAPLSLASLETQDYLDLNLEETMHLALSNSQVFRDLGGLVLRSPDAVRTGRDPAIVEAARQFGPFDWIFLDAGHAEHEVQADVDNYLPLARPGGVVALHDILPGKNAQAWIEVHKVWQRLQRLGFVTQELVADPENVDWGGIGIVFV